MDEPIPPYGFYWNNNLWLCVKPKPLTMCNVTVLWPTTLVGSIICHNLTWIARLDAFSWGQRSFASSPSTHLSSLTHIVPARLMFDAFVASRGHELRNVMDCHAIKENKTSVIILVKTCTAELGFIAVLQTIHPLVTPVSAGFTSLFSPLSLLMFDRHASNCMFCC